MKKPKFGAGNAGQSAGTGAEQNAENAAGLEEELKRYAGLSQEQLASEMLAQAARGRAAGTLTDAELEKFYASASGMLDERQRARLRTLIDGLKRGE